MGWQSDWRGLARIAGNYLQSCLRYELGVQGKVCCPLRQLARRTLHVKSEDIERINLSQLEMNDNIWILPMKCSGSQEFLENINREHLSSIPLAMAWYGWLFWPQHRSVRVLFSTPVGDTLTTSSHFTINYFIHFLSLDFVAWPPYLTHDDALSISMLIKLSWMIAVHFACLENANVPGI